MSITPILKPFEGERVLSVSPAPSGQVDDWNRRLNFFTGRALSDTALTAEQNGIAGRLAMRGQSKSPGVVTGLEIGLETNADGSFFLQVAPGLGTSASGEDVIIPTLLRVNLVDIHVYAPVSLLDTGTAPATGALVVRKLGDSLDTLIKKHLALPKVGFILLEPIVTDTLGNFDPTDQCEEDPSNDAFADEQLLDGCRIIYYAWPTEWLALPAPGGRLRNRLAYAVFGSDAARGLNEVLPWEQVGLPIGLLAFDDAWKPLFVDRSAVVREGGRPKLRSPIAPGVGNPFLWQARIQQFAEHLTDQDVTKTTPENLAKEFQFLPPVGLLPASALDFQIGTGTGATSRVAGTKFFPPGFALDAIPVPAEQLDVVVNACASLAPIDVSTPDQVTMMVPVPQIWYEPDLLQVLQVAPEFQKAIDDFVHRRAIWLKRRADVRQENLALVKAVSGTANPFPDPDPEAVEAKEDVASTQIDTDIDAFKDPELTYGTEPGAAPGQLIVTEAKRLRVSLTGVPGPGDELGELDKPGIGLEQFVSLLQARADAGNDQIDLGFLRVQTDIYRTRQNMLGSEAGSRLAVSPALATIAQGQSALATRDDLLNFLSKVKETVVPSVSTTPAVQPAEPGPTPSHSSAAPILRTSAFVAGASGASVPRSTSLLRTVPPAAIGGAAQSTFVPVNIGPAGLELAPRTTTGETARFVSTAGTSALFHAGPSVSATTDDVAQQRPIVGGTYDLRTTSVVERLKDPSSSETKSFTVASKYNAITGLKASGLKIDDIEIPGFLANGVEVTKKFGDITPTDLNDILAGVHDPVAAPADESAIFAAGVRAMEHSIQILRQVEGRIQAYRSAIQSAKNSIDMINALADSADRRLQSIGDELSTTRHDVSVARALLAEETGRVQGINDRRDQIVEQHVNFLAFCRPRTREAVSAIPVRHIDPGVTEAAVPAALARNVTPPAELRAMVNLLRDAPLSWFTYLPPVLNWLDRLETLHATVLYAKRRANFRLFQAPDPDLQTGPGPLGPHILSVFNAQKQVMTRARLTTANLDLTTFAGRTWQESRDLAPDFVSLGDLIDVGHLQPAVPRLPTAEIENILKVAAALYSDFGVVLPVIRLAWAERLVQIDGTINLANLSSLPRWGEIPILERNEMQSLTDWLYSRINLNVSDAVAHMNDLIRVCLLLASHAPVAEIIAGSVIRPTPIVVGGRIDLAADLGRVRVGMQVLMYSGNQTVARGVVENLATGQATARVLAIAANNVALGRNAKVHFAEPGAFERNPTTAQRLLY